MNKLHDLIDQYLQTKTPNNETCVGLLITTNEFIGKTQYKIFTTNNGYHIKKLIDPSVVTLAQTGQSRAQVFRTKDDLKTNFQLNDPILKIELINMGPYALRDRVINGIIRQLYSKVSRRNWAKAKSATAMLQLHGRAVRRVNDPNNINVRKRMLEEAQYSPEEIEENLQKFKKQNHGFGKIKKKYLKYLKDLKYLKKLKL